MIGFWRRLDRLGKVLLVAAHGGVVLVAAALVITWDTYWSQYVVTNVLPPSVWTLVGIAFAQIRLHRKLDANHEDMKKHVTAATGGADVHA